MKVPIYKDSSFYRHREIGTSLAAIAFSLGGLAVTVLGTLGTFQWVAGAVDYLAGGVATGLAFVRACTGRRAATDSVPVGVYY